MGWLTTGLRRSILLVLIVSAGGAFWSWRRESDTSVPSPPEWPPLRTPPSPPTASEPSSDGWADPLADGSCPIGHPVKANDKSGIFHLPGGRFYVRTKAQRCYSDAHTAQADGYRQAKH